MTTPNIQLPEVPEAIQDAADEINAGFLRLDAVVQLAVLDKDLTVAGLPADAVQGDRYIIESGDRARHVAMRGPEGWFYVVPRPGWKAYVLDEAATYRYNGTDWEADGGGGGITVPFMRGATWTRKVAIELPVNSPSISVPFDATITRAQILTEGGAGSCVIDVRKDAYANYPPTGGDSICAAAKPTIVTGIKYEDATLTGWTTAIAAGDVLRFVLESSSVFTDIYFTVELEPT